MANTEHFKVMVTRPRPRFVDVEGEQSGARQSLAEWFAEAKGHPGDVLVGDTDDADDLLARAERIGPSKVACVDVEGFEICAQVRKLGGDDGEA